MAYATTADVAAMTKNLAGNEADFSETSSPTLGQVEVWLSTGCALINAHLAMAGYTTPVATDSAAYDVVRQCNANYAAYYAELSRTNARSSPGERGRAEFFKEAYEDLLKALTETLDLTLLGVTAATSRGGLYAGGISVSDKETVKLNTDRVVPRFGGGAFSDPNRVRSGDN